MKSHCLPSLALARMLSLLVIVATAVSACSFPSITGLSPTLAPTIDIKALEATGTPAPEFPPARPPATATPEDLPAPSPAPALDSSGAHLPADLPPSVVQVDPPPGTDLLPGSALVIAFSEPMDRASVEAAFRADPPLPGAFAWASDASLRYEISGSLEPGARVAVEIGAAARALNGQALAQSWQAAYAVPGPARISRRLPEPGSADALPGSPVAVAFDRPLARAEDLASLPAAFTLDPPASGAGAWVSPSAYVFYPQPPLPGGAGYTVRLNADLFSRPGAALAEGEPVEWAFTVSPPRLLSTTPAPDSLASLAGPVSMEFSQPMDRASVEASFSLVDPKGQPAAGQFAWRDDGAAFTFTPSTPLDRGAEYTLLLLGAAAASNGAPLGADQVQRFTTFPPLEVTRSDPTPLGKVSLDSSGGAVKLEFSAPLKPGQDLPALLAFDPPLANPRYTLSPDGLSLAITGEFRAEMGYFLTASPGLRDRWDGPLSKPFRIQFTTSAVPPSLHIPALAEQAGSSVLFVPAGEVVIPAKAVNVGRVDFTRAPLSLPAFFAAAASGQPAPSPAGAPPETWSRLVYIQPNRVGDVPLSLSPVNGPLEPGVYFYSAVPTQLDGRPLESTAVSTPPVLLVVSHAQVTVKASPGQAFAWVVGSDRRPLEGQPVTFYDPNGEPLGSCSTGPGGVCHSEIPARAGLSSPVYAVISETGRADFSLGSSAWSAGLDPAGAAPLSPAAGPSRLVLYTDRAVYRAGQVVNFRALLRSLEDGRYTLPKQTSLEVSLALLAADQAAGNPVASVPVRLSAFGAGQGSLLLPQGLAPGRYALTAAGFAPEHAEIIITGEDGAGLTLEAAFAAPGGLVGDDLVVTFTARYAFGLPAAGLPLRWALYARPEPVTLPGGLESGVQDAADLDTPSAEADRVLLLEGEARTDSGGLAALRIPGGGFAPRLKPGMVYRLSLEAAVGQVSASASTRVFPSQVMIGLKPESFAGTAGQPLVAAIKTTDWEGAPAAGQSLRALFQKILWSQETAADGRTQTQVDYADAGSTDFVTSEKGEARLQFAPNEPGMYRLEISGGGAVTSRLLWVGGEGSASWPRLSSPRLPLLASASSYRPGEVASILIPNPFGSPAQALVTVERERVLRWEVVEVTGASLVYLLPLSSEDAPGVTVTITLLGQEENRPSFRFGRLPLQVEPSAQILRLSLATSPAEPVQGDEVTLALQAAGSQGEPVVGEVSIAIVSKGAESEPGVVSAFYSPQDSQVVTGTALAIYARRPFYLPPVQSQPSAEAGSTFAPLAGAPGETVYWNGSVITAENGEALVTFRLPARPGDWVVIARGITADSRVGEARLELSIVK